MLTQNSKTAMSFFQYIYNFLRMCFGDEMTRIGRLEFVLRGMKTKAGQLCNPLIFFHSYTFLLGIL